MSVKHKSPVPPMNSRKNRIDPLRVPMASNTSPLKSFATIRHAPLTAISAAAASVEKPSEVNNTPK